MLGFLFGFNARIGRLQYFLYSLGLGFAVAVITFVVVGQVYRSGAMLLPTHLIKGPLVIVAIAATWVSFTLQCMRVRDIGWDPVCVIPGWFALLVVDKIIATKFPAWALDSQQHGTAVGAVVNFGLMLALTFWPSGDPDGPAFDEPRHAPPRGRDRVSPVASRIARVASGEFGRRTG